MSITIIPIIPHETYEINGNKIYKDTCDNWVSIAELTQRERQAFQNYIQLIIDNKGIKKHPKATYRLG